MSKELHKAGEGHDQTYLAESTPLTSKHGLSSPIGTQQVLTRPGYKVTIKLYSHV